MNNTHAAAILLACFSLTGRAAEKAAVEPFNTSRTVACQSEDVIRLNTQLNYATLIQFSPNETVVGAFWGDTDRWSVDKVQNMLVVKPSVKATRTDPHIITASGQVCSFSLREVSNDAGQVADLKLRVTTPASNAPDPAKQVFMGPGVPERKQALG
jgi:type IV secretory pathway VirB9-like protein